MDVKFKSENGFCPYFIHGDTKFYIQDRRNSNREYAYSLCSKKIGGESVIEFDTDTECKKYVQKLKSIRYIGGSGRTSLYTDLLQDYIIKDKTVTIRQSYRTLSYEYPTYLDCLEFAKKRIPELIKMNEAEQISMF